MVHAIFASTSRLRDGGCRVELDGSCGTCRRERWAMGAKGLLWGWEEIVRAFLKRAEST